jgi:N-acetylneuraminate epimerase
MKVINFIAAIMISFIQPSLALAQDDAVRIDWTIAAKLPPARPNEKQLGLAGVFAGLSEDVLLIAGGSYFPGKKPWEGGKKTYISKVIALKRGADGTFKWVPTNECLKQPAAYGMSTTVPEGVICAGGENEHHNSMRDVYLMKWDTRSQEINLDVLPSLPIPLANACMASIGNQVFLFGGESNGQPSNKSFKLALNDLFQGWQPLPDLPVAMSHSVAVVQSNGNNRCLYVIGGRSSTASGVSELHSSAFCFDPELNTWKSIHNIGVGQTPTNLSAAAGVPYGDHSIILIGGDKGDIFHQIEVVNSRISSAKNEMEKQRLLKEKLKLVNHHPGFSREVLVYNTLKDSWRMVNSLPVEGHVTTTALIWRNEIIIAAGEIMPGIRTPDVLRGQILHDE